MALIVIGKSSELLVCHMIFIYFKAAKKQMELTLHIYKDRNQIGNSFTLAEVREKFEDPMAWVKISGDLVKTEKYNARYDNHHAFELQIKECGDNVVPSKGYVVCQNVVGDSKSYNGYNLKYDTVLVHEPRLLTDGLVGTSLKVTKPNIRDLKPILWKQLGSPTDTHLYLLKLQLVDADAFICKDDVTGEYYPYVISKILYLSKK